MTEKDGKISDGTIIVPKFVTIDRPFTVELEKRNLTFEGETFEWISGGVSTLKAVSEDELATSATAKIFVDVPVHSLQVTTSALLENSAQSKFDVNSSFYAKATFFPEESVFKYSKNDPDGENGFEQKSVFFNSIENEFIEMQPVTESNFGSHNAVFQAKDKKDNVILSAFAFKTAKEEDKAFEEIEGIFGIQNRYEEILSRFQRENVQSVYKNAEVEVSPLVVGSFSTSSLEVKTKFNDFVTIMVNNSVSDPLTQFSLGVKILTSDEKTELTNHYERIGIAFAVNVNGEYFPATNQDFFIRAGKQIEKIINGKTYSFFLPNVDSENLGASSFEVMALKENLMAEVLVVLFDGDENNADINSSSFLNGEIKNVVVVEPQGKISNRVYWSNHFITTRTLYIQKSVSGDFYSNYNFANPTIDNATAYVHQNNTYKTIKYFAYLVDNEGRIISAISEGNGLYSGKRVYDFINVKTVPTFYNIGASTIELYEIIDGNLLADKEQLPEGYEIKVIFATVITDENQKPVMLENGGYSIDRVSTDTSNNLQALSFDIKQVLKTLEAKLVFDNENYTPHEEDTYTVAVVHNKENAFKVVFDVNEEEKEIFIRDYNAGKIEIKFLIDGQVAQGFVYTNQPFSNQETLEVWIDIRNIEFSGVGSDFFEVELWYMKGDLRFGDLETFKITSAKFNVESPSERLDIEWSNANFEVYDGLIYSLEFSGDLEEVTQNNPISVKTAFYTNEDAGQHPIFGVLYPSQESTTSLEHPDIAEVKEELFVANATVGIVAKDKYGKDIAYEPNIWRLVSLAPEYVSVGADGQTLNFEKTSSSPVKVYIETSNYAIGGNSLISNQSLYFNVETRGSIVEVVTKTPQSELETVWENPTKNYIEESNAWEIDLEDYIFENTENIFVSMQGFVNTFVNLTILNQENLLRVLYALPKEDGLYEVFDLVAITNFYLVGQTSLYDDFINFYYNDEGGIQQFEIAKNFGSAAELKFIAQTLIGINFTIIVNIEPVIGANISENFAHDNAIDETADVIYYGVFAQHKIEIDIVGFEGLNLNLFSPLVYDFDTKKVLALFGENLSNNQITINNNNSVNIVLYLPDTSGFILRNLVFVLDHKTEINKENYVRNIFDFSKELKFKVNPNVTVGVGTKDGVEYKNQEVVVLVNQKVITNFVSIIEEEGILFVTGKVERKVALETNSTTLPYINAYLTDSTGTQRKQNNSEDYVRLENNTLTIMNEFNNQTTFYVAIEHKTSSTLAYKLPVYYKVVLVPDISEKVDGNENFVTYDGARYLQLISTKGQDSSQDANLSTEQNVVYTFDTIIDMFETKEAQRSFTIKFDVEFMNNWWNVSAQSITLFKRSEPKVGGLNIIVTLNQYDLSGNVVAIASKEFPVILLPLKAPFIRYGTNPVEEDLGLVDRNDLANKDLIYSIGKIGLVGVEKYEKLYSENVYDLVNDATEEIDLFDGNSIIELTPDLFTYLVFNDPMSDVLAGAETDLTNGKLKTPKLGEDAFVIVVLRFNNQFDIYYRLKIKASSELRVFYPYYDVESEEEDKAEYLFLKEGQSSASIDFSAIFEEDVPISSQIIENIYRYDEENKVYIPVEEETPKSRIGLFRKLAISPDFEAYEKREINLRDITILSIARDSGPVESNWSTYVEKDQQHQFKFIFKESLVRYTVVFKIEADLYAETTYKVVVEPKSTNLKYEVVKDNSSGNISSMELLANNHKFIIEAPLAGSEEPSTITEGYNLNDLLLRRVIGTISIDETEELKYHIFEDTANILTINENRQLVAEYTPNNVKAKIMFYTKYGKVATYEILVESKIFVANQSKEKISSLELFAGSTLDFANKIKFVEKDNEEEDIYPIDWQVEFKNLPQGKELPDFIEKTENAYLFYILPIQQNLVNVQITITVDLAEHGLYVFDFELIINKNLESKALTSAEAIEHEEDVYAKETFEIKVFGGFFEDFSQVLGVDKEDNQIFVINEQEETDYFKYNLLLTAINSASAVDLENITISDGRLSIPTLVITNETVITLKAVLTFEKNMSEGRSYHLSFESYYSFKLLPNTMVEAKYPIVNGSQHDREAIVHTADKNISLSKSNVFRQEQERRVEITNNKNGEPITAESDFEIKVKIRVVSGESDKLKVNGVYYNEIKNDYYDYFADDFTFTLEEGGLSYSQTALDVYVDGILRNSYNLYVYKEVTAVYGIQINRINNVNAEGREVFYLGEDLTEIFAGVQAIKFLVDSQFRSTLTLKVFKLQDNGILKDLNLSTNLSSVDATFEKVIKLSYDIDRIDDFLDLTNENIRFKLVQNGVESAVKTIRDLTLGENNSPVIFARTVLGEASLELVKRIEATYLREVVQNKNFLEKINLVETQPFNYLTYNIRKEGLDGNNLFKNGEVKIYFGENNLNNSLGDYQYQYKVNLEVGVTEYEINVGDEIKKVLDTFEIKKITGGKFVTYNGETPVSYAEVITSERVEINFYFKSKEDEPNKTEYFDAITGEAYVYTAGLSPIGISAKTVSGGIKYDFSMIARGANNNGVKVVGIFEYRYKDPSGNSEEDIIFTNQIEIVIKPVWQVSAQNRYITGANSLQNPEVITSNLFVGDVKELAYLLVDTRVTNDGRGIVIRRSDSNVNYAVDFGKILFEEPNSAYAYIGDTITNQDGDIVAKEIKLKQPAFQEVNPLTVILEDDYGFKAFFYFKIHPDKLIEYRGGLHDSQTRIYEGDTFILKHEQGEGDLAESFEHIVFLNDQSLNPSPSLTVRFTLINNSTKKVLADLTNKDFVGINEGVEFSYLNSENFSKTLHNLYVYLKIELKNKVGNDIYETYTISSEPFYLYQRYVTNVGLTSIRDGVETNLVNHIDIEDKKFDSLLGVPYLIEDQTLVITDVTFNGSVTITAFNNTGDIKNEIIEIEEINEEKIRYISLQSVYSNTISDMSSYNFRVTKITYKNKIELVYEYVSKNLTINNLGQETGKYLVRLANSQEVKDVLLDVGQSVLVPSISPNNFFGIVGYEKYNSNSSFGLEFENENNQEDLTLHLPNVVTNYKITLININATLNAHIKTLEIRFVENNLYEIKATLLNGQFSMHHNIELINGSNGEKIIKLKHFTETVNYDFLDGNQFWIISSYNYYINNKIVDNVEFKILKDKKLTVVTTEVFTSTNVNEKVKIHFNGVVSEAYIEVTLDRNGKQEFSVLEKAVEDWNYDFENFNSNNFKLRQPNAIDMEDLLKIKGIKYYNDTLQFKMSAAQGSGDIYFSLTKNGDENSSKTIRISISAYENFAKTFTLGISNIFGEVIKEEDVYTLTLTSHPGIDFEFFKVIWPNQKEIEVDFTTSEIDSYVVTAFDSEEGILIENGNITINLDSKGLYETYYNTKLVPIKQFYLIEFNQAIHYVEPVEFKVSPYYFGVDTSLVYGNLQNSRLISDYSQYTPESSNNLAFIVQKDTWTENIPLIDPYGNPIMDGNKVYTLKTALEQEEPIVKVSLDTASASGSGRIDEQNNLIVEISKEESIENVYFAIDVLVALNGDITNNQWLSIGQVHLGFDTHNQYFLNPEQNYIILTEKNDETYVKYVEIDATEPTTFSVSKLFQDDSIELSKVSTLQTDNGLANVYLKDKEQANYKVSFSINEIEINTVLQSSVIVGSDNKLKPMIIGSNILKGQSVSFALTIEGVTHNGTYNHNEDEVLFGEISLSDIKKEGTQDSFATLTNGVESFTLKTNDESRVKVFWSKIDLTEVEENLSLNYFGDGKGSEEPKEVISGIILASPMFKVSKIGNETTINSIKVNVAPKEANLSEPKIEHYAVTQIVLNQDKIVQNAQTVVYKVENNKDIPSAENIDLVGTGSSYEQYTNLVLVEKLDNFIGIRGPALFNTNFSSNTLFYEYSVGVLKVGESNIEFEESLKVFKQGKGEDVEVDNISETFVLEDIIRTTDQSLAGATQHATILVRKLEIESQTPQPDGQTVYEVKADFGVDNSKEYNLITQSYGANYGNFETQYTYELVKTERELLTFNGNEIKFIVDGTNLQGLLIWHEFISRDIGALPNNFVYYNYYDMGNESVSTRKASDKDIYLENDGDIISDMWDGTIYIDKIAEQDYAKVTYQAEDNTEHEMFYIVNEYRLNGNYINLAKLFDQFDNGNINKTKFSSFDKHTSISDKGLTSNGVYNAIYEISENQEKVYSIFIIDNNVDSISIFDLIKAEPGQDIISRVLSEKLNFTPFFSIGWRLEDEGYYAFEQAGKFKVIKLEGANKTYNLFEIFETDILSISEGEITISNLNTQLVIETTAEQPLSINVRLNQGTENQIIIREAPMSYDSTTGSYNVVVYIENLENGDDFLQTLTSMEISVYQVNDFGQEIIEGIIFEQPTIKNLFNSVDGFKIVVNIEGEEV